ncbi:MAG: hypothetical protein GXO45_04210 [Aquificae bacterium]|nr:hypothetical protein [Aquificota bacterium]
MVVNFSQAKPPFGIKPVVMGQLWTVYPVDIKGVDKPHKIDTYIRRGRFGVKGDFFKIILSYDNYKKDKLDPVDLARGSVSYSTPDYRLQLWDAYIQVKGFTAGYFRPQVGKESITSGFKVVSLEKALTNSYVRRHITGKPDWYMGDTSTNGRLVGVNYGWASGRFKVDTGVFDGYNFSDGHLKFLLFAFRGVFRGGDFVNEGYSISHTQTYLGRKNGYKVGFYSAFQKNGIEKTLDNQPAFKDNSLVGADLFFSFDGFEVSGEYDFLSRKWKEGGHYTDRVWHFKVAYNLWSGDKVIQPSVSVSRFSSSEKSLFKGRDNNWFDMGINYYIKGHNLKTSIHYGYGKLIDYPSTGLSITSKYISVSLQFRL